MGILLKKKMIIIIIIIAISITVGTTAIYFLNRAGVFFDPGNRYPSTNLNYMGVLFENESDINAFNEGYSESASCPWGFEHNGIDYFFNNGTNVLAASPGQVWEIEKHQGEGENKYHVRIWIRFNSSVSIGYNFEPWTSIELKREQQISMFKVEVGDWIQKGDIIAEFLQCNVSAHIHFDIIENGGRYCPTKYFDSTGFTQLMNLIHSYHPTWNLCYP